jgi:hypothetical protein
MTKQLTTVRDVLRRESEATLRWTLTTSTDSDRKRVIAAELGRRRAHDAAPDLMRTLIDARSTCDWRVVEAAAEALGRIGSGAAGPYLTELLSDQHLPVGVRDTAAFALGRIEYRRAIPTLINALSAPHKTVRLCAAAALAAVADSSIVPRIATLLPTEADDDVRKGLERLLVCVKDRSRSAQQGWLLAIVGDDTREIAAPQAQDAVLDGTQEFPDGLLRTRVADVSIGQGTDSAAMNEYRVQPREPWRFPNSADPRPAPRRHQAWPASIASEG